MRLRKDFNGISWPAEWKFDMQGDDLIAEEAAREFCSVYWTGTFNQRVFGAVKSMVARAIVGSKEQQAGGGEAVDGGNDGDRKC